MVDGIFGREELFGDFPPNTVHGVGFVELDDEPLNSLPIPNPDSTHFICKGFYFWDSVEDDGGRLNESPCRNECVDCGRREGDEFFCGAIWTVEVKTGFLQWVREDVFFDIVIA